ncbi:MAG: DUF4336 domain-containing protein [Motiliproteus sp.]
MLNKVAEDIWTVDGAAVPFFGMPYTTRMTVIRLASGELWVHSPSQIDVDLMREISALGEVKYLLSPNKLHHLFLLDWINAFPQAHCYASPGLAKKRPDIQFTKELGMRPEVEWSKEIDQTIFKGSPGMQEVVFFHRRSKTLILTDLIENFNPSAFNRWQRLLARFTGILSPNGRTPVDWRLSFLFGKKQARQSLAVLMAWAPDKIVISHGDCIWEDSVQFLKKSFSWV